MAGIFSICPVDTPGPIPIEKQNVSYGQEAFILQQYTPTPVNPVNFKAPRKWEITVDSQVAVMAASDPTNCPLDSCAQLIWIYDGIGNNARFIGTAADFQNKLHLTSNNTATLYFVTMDLGSDYMAVIANEVRNLEKCSSFNAKFYSGLNSRYKETLNSTGPTGGACLTVLNHCQNGGLCDGVVLYDAYQYGNDDFYVYAGAPNPYPIQNRLGIENYSQQSTSNLFPQNFAGNARTFYIANGSALLSFGDPLQWNNQPFIGRWGFVRTNFYPTFSSNMYGGSLDLTRVDHSYNITLKLNTTYAPVGSNAYLEFDKNGQAVQRMSFDVNTNVGAQFTVYVEANSYARIFLWGGKYENMGSYASFTIGEGVTTTTTTTTPRPTTASTPSTSPKATVPTSVSTPSTKTVVANTTTTTRPTYPPTTPKTSAGIYFLMATVFSVLISIL